MCKNCHFLREKKEKIDRGNYEVATQRYKSHAGFAIFPLGAIYLFCDIPLGRVGELYHIAPSEARYFTICDSISFQALREQSISFY